MYFIANIKLYKSCLEVCSSKNQTSKTDELFGDFQLLNSLFGLQILSNIIFANFFKHGFKLLNLQRN